jgi:hypothetical protein
MSTGWRETTGGNTTTASGRCAPMLGEGELDQPGETGYQESHY